MASAVPYREYQATIEDLARAIRSLRPECAPREAARELLALDRPGHHTLVGLDYAGEKAVFHHAAGGYAIAVRFGIDGLADGGARIATPRPGPELARWIETRGSYWGWIHPRHR